MSSESAGLILTLDCNRRNLELLSQFLVKAGYKTLPIVNLDELACFLDTCNADAPTVGLALLDISGFGPQIWQYCARLQAKNIPLLIISSKQSSTLQQESLAHGARGMLVKPLVVKELLKIVATLIDDKENRAK
jgi:DNA-binding response OmpR family regulator